MTRTRFMIECARVNILPELALEKEEIVSALKERDDKLVVSLLEECF